MTRPDPGPRLAVAELRRLEALRRLGVAGTNRVGELDGFLELVADVLAARSVSFTVIDQDVARVLGEIGQEATVRLDGRWSVARDAVDSSEGRARWTVGPGADRVRLPTFGRSEHPVTLAAVAVAGPGQERIGALVATWLGDVPLPSVVWRSLERAAAHVTTVLGLRAEAAEYRRFLELSPFPLLVLDEHGDIEVANPAVAELLGAVDPDDLRDRAFTDLVADQDSARVLNELSRVLFSPRQRVTMDATLLDADGHEIAATIAFSYLQGVRNHLQLAVHDLSDRLRAEDSRTQLLEQLARAQRLDAVGQIAGGLAHDLNNLLAVMSTNLSLAVGSVDHLEVAADTPVLAELREDLAELSTAVERATTMTEQLLDFARRRPGAVGRADVAEIVDGVVSLLAASLGDGVEMATELAEGLPEVATDPVHLERAVLNLVNNARDAVGRAGTITIRAVTDRLAVAGDGGSGADRDDRPAVRLEVADDGVGMDELTRVRAFEPLFTTKGDEGGTGLGLPSVLAFSTAMNADLHLTSAPGKGTTVSLTLPVEPPEASTLEAHWSEPVGGARVLLVEPGEYTQRVIAQMLVGAGYRVATCRGGDEALAALERGPVDLLVTELVLPVLAGHRLIRTARELHPGLAVVVLSSVEAPRELEGDPVLLKPFSQTRLLRTAARVLERI